MLKRRNLDVDDEPLSPLQEQNRQAAANMSIEDIVAGIYSGDSNKEITATHAARKILSRERNPPIDILINAKLIQRQRKLGWILRHIEDTDANVGVRQR